MQNSESFKQQTVRRYEESAGATVLEVSAERDIDGTLIRKCDHIHTKKRHTHQNGQVASGKQSFGGICADVGNGLLSRKSRQKFVRRVVRAAPHLI